ncbi:hypothetical protein G854_02635 [Escherichia coli HVH 202 (4-3163997)]|nr:hypothetical protein G854_02635 [Escherichia coli HVH 202 (4-3163997)]
MSGEKKAKGWRFYGLVGFGAIALLSAGVWALQYSGSGPEKTLSPLVVHNNLQIDLNEPDLFLDSDSLSQLPKDLLTIPFLHDVLSEDFVFYYQNHADRLGIGKRAARTVLTGMCYSVGSATRQGSSSPTRFIGQSAMTSRT